MIRIKMLYCLLLLLGLAAFAIDAEAQVKPSSTPKPTPTFTGTWTFVRTETPKDAFKTPKPLEIDVSSYQEEMVIEHDGLKMTFRRTSISNGDKLVIERVFYTDGRGEINPIVDSDSVETVSRTTLKGRKLIIERIIRKRGSAEKMFGTMSEWTVSKDDQTLIERETSLPSRDRYGRTIGLVNRVYKRK